VARGVAAVVKLDLTEKEGQPARLVATLDNTAGTYTGLAALRPNAQLLLSQGYVGAGRVATHLFFVDEWTYVRAADVSQVVVVASDRAAWLERQARRPVSYAGATVAAIAAPTHGWCCGGPGRACSHRCLAMRGPCYFFVPGVG
jgi:phage protein D